MMKKQINFLLLFTLISCVLTGQTFEGTIKMTSDSPYGINADFTIKDNNILLENPSKDGTVQMIFDTTTGDIITISSENGKKMAIKTNTENNPYLKAQTAKSTNASQKFTIEKTDETKVIDGYNCTKFTGKDGTSEGYAWVTTELGIDWEDLTPMKSGAGRNPYRTGFGKEGMFLEMYMKEPKIKQEWTMKAKVKKVAINDEKFQVPAGVQVMDMTDMRQLMMEAQRDPEKMKELKEMMQKNK
jgi:hypothetical protein